MLRNATLVVGAGELGIAILRALSESESHSKGSLSVLLRLGCETTQVQAQRDIILGGLGVNIVRADLATATEDELATIFADYSTVICCSGYAGGQGTQRKITAAVLKAGVERYIPWQFGVDYDVFGRGSGQDVWDEHCDVRDMLRAQSSTHWIIVSTGMFTSFLFEPSFGLVDLDGARVHALGRWDHRLTVTTPEDIGRLTAAILVHQPRIDDQIVYIAGDTFSYAQLADMNEEHLDRRVERILWSKDTLRAEVMAHLSDGIRKYRLAFARADGVPWAQTRTFNFAQNITVTDVPTWLRQQRG